MQENNDTAEAPSTGANVEELTPSSTAVRYSDAELEDFKENLINPKLAQARDDFKTLKDTDVSEMKGAEKTTHLESLRNAGLKITELEEALVRVDLKTYGLCTQTGTLIPKERLRLVPTARIAVVKKA